MWLSDIWVMDLIFFFLLFLYTEFTPDATQVFGSKFLCFHGNMQFGNRSSIFFSYSKNSTLLNFSRTVFKNNCS